MVYRVRMFFVSTLCCVVLFFSLYHYHYAIASVEYIASVIAYPFLCTSRFIVTNIQNRLISWHSVQDLHKQIDVLKVKNKELLQELIKAHSTVWYSNQTIELIEYAQRYDVDHKKLVHVLLKNSASQEQFCLVDAGSAQGIEQDMVAVYKNCLIGRVSEVYPLYSKVVLVTDKNCKIAAYCCQSKVSGIYQGDHENAERGLLLFISHLHKLKQGDLVISSGQGLVFPQGFGIGTIESWKLSGLYYDIAIKPLVALEELDYFYLIKKGNYASPKGP